MVLIWSISKLRSGNSEPHKIAMKDPEPPRTGLWYWSKNFHLISSDLLGFLALMYHIPLIISKQIKIKKK